METLSASFITYGFVVRCIKQHCHIYPPYYTYVFNGTDLVFMDEVRRDI